MTGEVVWACPARSQEFDEHPRLERLGATTWLWYDFETESGAYECEALTFHEAVATLFVDERRCQREQVRALDRLVEIPAPPWVRALPGVPPASRVFRIYFDSLGCYEVVAAGFSPPAARVDWH